MLVYEDYGVPGPEDRARVLRNVFESLRPGGFFALDVVGEGRWDSIDENPSWYASGSGFWRPDPHVVLDKTIRYPDVMAYCDLHVVVCGEEITAYTIYNTIFTPQRITEELTAAGFQVVGMYADLMGGVLSGGKTDQLGVIAQKAAL